MINRVSSQRVKGLRSLCFLCLFAAVPGCSERTAETESYSEPAYSKQYRGESLTVIVSLSETNIPSSGKITAMLEVHTPDGVEPAVPSIGSLIDPFTPADGYREPAQHLPNGRILHRLVWVLIPALPGETVFQPITIQAGAEQLQTEPIPVRVTSLIPAGTQEPDFRDIAGPIELLPEQQQKRRSLYTVAGSLLILLLIPFLILLFRKPKTEPCARPHEEALDALEQLPEDPVERIHECSRIFRVYHQAQFGMPMAGKTAVELSAVLEDAEMIRFLEQADAVRFSNRVPVGFAEEAEQFVRQYVEKTMEVPE